MLKKIQKKFIGFVSKNQDNKELVFDSVFALIIRGLASVATLIMTLIITRYLGATQSGYFFLAYTILWIVANVARLGTDNVLIKYASIHSSKNEWYHVQSILKIILKRTVIVSIIVGVLISLCANYIAEIFKKPDLAKPLFWMGFSIPMIVAYTVYANALQGLKKVVASVSLQNVTLPVLVIVGICIFGIKTSTSAGFIYFIASCVTLITAFYYWKKYTFDKAGEYDDKIIWSSSKYFWTKSNLNLFVAWGGQFIGGFFIDAENLSKLAVAQRTSQLVSFILIAINLVSAPRFASLYHNNQMNKLSSYAKNATRLMTLIATPLVLFICIFSKTIMSVFGKGFSGGASLLIILSIGQFFNAITGSVGYLLSMSGYEKDNRNIAIINGVVSFVLALILIPIYGALGAAISTSLGVATQNLMGVHMVKKRLGFNTLSLKEFSPQFLIKKLNKH